MLTVGVVLYLLVAVGLLAMTAKYAFGPSPARHHAQALEATGIDLTPSISLVLKVVYIPLAAACASMAVVVSALALGPISAGEFWATATASGAGLVFGIPTMVSSMHFERRSGVHGPYRQVAALTGLIVAAFIFANA